MSELLKTITAQKHDAVLYKTNYLLTKAGDDVHAFANAVNDICVMLSCIPNEIKRDSYQQTICKKFKKIKSKLLKEGIEDTLTKKAEEKVFEAPEGSKWRFPKGVDPEKAYECGFYAYENKLDTGYYFPNGQGSSWTQQSNFIIKPLMHIQSKTDDKRMFEITNPFGRAIVDMPSRGMISLEQFKGTMFELPGNNLFFGTQQHLMKILNIIGREFELCYELKTLGWQQEGFFAYSNGIVTSDGFVPMDDRGIADFNNIKYYSPSASAIYRNARKDDDEYENDRYLFYKDSPVKFEEWCKQIVKVYAESNAGAIGVAFVFVGLFKDIIYSIDNNCPHLSAYGEKGSGKSKFAESLSNIFLNGLLPCNLFHSTDFAFANRISRYRNCITWFDEFNDSTIKEERFEAVKAAYEGVARERGKGTNKGKTELLKVNSAMVLTGQYLSTKDDNAALTRCIIIPFRKRSEESARTIEEVQDYNKLKDLEKLGLSSMLVELLAHRVEFAKEYPRMFPEEFAELRNVITSEKGLYNERVMRNYCALLTSVKFFSQKFSLGFTYQDFFQLIKQEIIKASTLIAESDSLADFWNTIVYLMETGEIYDGFHFKIEEVSEVALKSGKRTFPKPEKLLFMRLTTVHKLYMEAHRRQSGKTGVPKSTIELYLSTSKGYVGHSSSGWFADQHGNRTNTSSEVFLYDALNVPLQRFSSRQDEVVLTEITGKPQSGPVLKDVAGVPCLHYTILVDESYKFMDKTVEKMVRIQCYDKELSNEIQVNPQHMVTVNGELKISRYKNKEGEDVELRKMDVKTCKMVEQQMKMPVSFGGEGKQEDLPF